MMQHEMGEPRNGFECSQKGNLTLKSLIKLSISIITLAKKSSWNSYQLEFCFNLQLDPIGNWPQIFPIVIPIECYWNSY
jgi:hypothetical protein